MNTKRKILTCMKHTPVFLNIGHCSKPMTVHIATLTPEGRLGECVSPQVLADYAGNLTDCIAAYDRGDLGEGERILHNLA